MNIKNENQWNEAFVVACQKGSLEELRHLFQKQYLEAGFADIHCENEAGFRKACYHGHLEVVKYLLTSPELIKAGHTFADLHAWDEYGLRWACENGHLNVVKYLLTSPELIKAGHTFANLHAGDELGLIDACVDGHFDVVKYLLTSPDLKVAGHAGADIHANDDEAFRSACCYGHVEIVKWLVMDYGIEKTQRIDVIIQEYPQAQEYFRVRQELQEMEEAMLMSKKLSSEELRLETRADKKAKKL